MRVRAESRAPVVASGWPRIGIGGMTMRLRRVTQHGLTLIALVWAIQLRHAQASGGARALQVYQETVGRADAPVDQGNER